MLKIENLIVKVHDQLVIDNLNLEVATGKIDALMGPNGSGKSSLAMTLMGHPEYQLIAGKIIFNNIDITNFTIHDRAKLGFFLAFQHPQAISGLKVFSFLKTIYEAYTGQIISVPDFNNILLEKLELVGLGSCFLEREVNVGFSGGEKKRFEILQLLLLNPKIAIIDEIDSGLDIDALKLIANAIMQAKLENPDLIVLLITHYRRILNFLNLNQVHIMQQGKIVKSGNINLIEKLEQTGYENLI